MYHPFAEVSFLRVELLPLNDLTVRILNTGNVATGQMTLSLSGANADVFTLPSPTVANLAVGGESDITLTPRAALKAGTYKATLTLNADGISPVSIEITYTQTTTGNDNPQPVTLKAWTLNGLLHVEGLTAGERWSVYTISGTLVHISIARDTTERVRLDVSGIYVVTSGGKSVKVKN